VFRQRVSQFNGCVPYAGVSTATRVDEAVLPVLFALLPVPQPVGITVAPPSLKARSMPAQVRSRSLLYRVRDTWGCHPVLTLQALCCPPPVVRSARWCCCADARRFPVGSRRSACAS
jgi:hypothetical protein